MRTSHPRARQSVCARSAIRDPRSKRQASRTAHGVPACQRSTGAAPTRQFDRVAAPGALRAAWLDPWLPTASQTRRPERVAWDAAARARVHPRLSAAVRAFCQQPPAGGRGASGRSARRSNSVSAYFIWRVVRICGSAMSHRPL